MHPHPHLAGEVGVVAGDLEVVNSPAVVQPDP